MTTFIAYANIQQPFPFDEIPTDLVPENLRTELQGNSRITQRHQCRRLAHFLLWQLLKTAGKSTALLAESPSRLTWWRASVGKITVEIAMPNKPRGNSSKRSE